MVASKLGVRQGEVGGDGTSVSFKSPLEDISPLFAWSFALFVLFVAVTAAHPPTTPPAPALRLNY